MSNYITFLNFNKTHTHSFKAMLDITRFMYR